MRIFETATRGLRHMHDSEELRCLENVSEGYYQAEQANDQLKKKVIGDIAERGHRTRGQNAGELYGERNSCRRNLL